MKFLVRKKWNQLYYSVKDFFFPWNVIKLKSIDRSWHDTDERMEEAIMQLLSDFFDGEQPFHGWNYEKNPTIARHRELLLAHREDMDAEKYATFDVLLDILEWYRLGGLKVSGQDVFMAAHTSGMDLEECKRLEDEFEKRKTKFLSFVVENRRLLWT